METATTIGRARTSARVRDFDQFERGLYRFVYGQLQNINTEIDQGRKTPIDFLMEWEKVQPGLEPAIQRFMEMGEEQAREMLTRLAFVPTSFEHHLQRRGEKPGVGLSMLQYMERALIALGAAAHHPPRDSHHTLWILDAGEARCSFTGHHMENAFAHSVAETDRLNRDTCWHLRRSCCDPESIGTRDAVFAFRAATSNVGRLCDLYIALRDAVSPIFFTTELRSYLVPYAVGGEVYAGPNAANLASPISLDYLTGFPDATYYERTVVKRMAHMTPTERFQVQRDVEREPISQILVDAMGLSAEQFALLTEAEIAATIVGQTACFRAAICEFAAFAKSQIRLSGIHWSLILSHLIAPSKTLASGDIGPVSPHAGVGGASHADTHSIFAMRRTHPVISKLIAAVAHLPEGVRHEAGI